MAHTTNTTTYPMSPYYHCYCYYYYCCYCYYYYHHGTTTALYPVK